MADEIQNNRNIHTAEKEWDNDGIAFNENTNVYRLIRALLSQADRIDNDLESIRDAHHIDEATGRELDEIGKLVQLQRKSSEDDPKYRARLKVQFRVGNIGTTFDEFSEFSAVLLETNLENIEFVFNYEARPATVQVAADPEVYTNSALTRSEVSKYLGRAVPAGHEVNALEKGSFRLKSDGETDDPSKGLTSDSTSDGGTLASDIL